MKPTTAIRSFLALAGSSLLAISYSHAQTILADSYLTSLNVASPTSFYASRNFPSILDGPLTGSSTLTLTGYFQGQLSLVNNAGNTFTGNIVVDSGTLRVAGSTFDTLGGFVAGSMTSSDTITINRAGNLTIDNNVGSVHLENRFGTDGSRPAVDMAGGTLFFNGRNSTASQIQTFGALTSSSGQGTINVTRTTNGTPTLTFSSLAINSGSLLTFNGTALGTGTNDARITFTTAPTLTNGIIAGARFFTGSAGTSELATYGANGVTAFTAYDVSSNDINGATSTQNVQIPTGTSAATLIGDVSVNSLNFAGNAGWSLGGNKLTITSGMLLRNGTNADPGITNGTLTAGNGTDDIDLNIIVAQNAMTIGAVIADNGSSNVTLVKSGDGRSLTLNGGAANTYTGGTYVVGGGLITGNVANRTYLGSGKVTVDGLSDLTLNNIGATSNVGSGVNADYTAINTGRINLANLAYTADDTFNIGANSIIAGATTPLNSLDRTSNITLAENAIIGHSTALTAALNLTTGTIKNLGTNADLYYGLNATQGNSAGAITIGTGTAFKGISGMRNGNTSWSAGIINVASGTTDVYFQSMSGLAYQAPDVFTLGNGSSAGGIVVNMLGTGNLDVNLAGRFSLNETAAAFGDTSNSRNVRFVVGAGSELGIGGAAGMGSGTGIASALVQNGGFIRFAQGVTASDAFNGAVTVEEGGRFDVNLAAGLTGTGALTFNEGSILNITTSATAFSGSQASAASIAAGTIVRLGVSTYGSATDTLENYLGTKSPIYQLTTNVAAANPTSLGTTIMTLNKNGSGVGGILTNALANANLNATTNGVVTLGANGGVIAATTGTTLTVAEDIVGGALTIGTTAIIDGAPKAGIVTLSNAANAYTGGTTVNSGLVLVTSDAHLGDTAGSITLNGGGLGIGTSFASNRELILNDVAGNLVRIQGNATWTHTGNITGDGGVTFRQNPNGPVTADLQGTANTFKGALGIEFNNGGMTVKLRSMADSATANGNIIFGTNTGFAGNALTFEWASAAAGGLTLNNRAIEFAQNGDSYSIIKNSHATEAITINTDLVVSGTGTKNLDLDAVAGPDNVFAGNISDGSGTLVLRKFGAGSWNLSGENTHTGSTTNVAGILVLDNALALQNSALDTAASTGGSGTAGLRTTQTALTLGGLTGNKNFASTGGVFSTTSGGYGSVAALTLNPGSDITHTYTGGIADGAAGMTLTKTGGGTQILGGTNGYTGATTVNEGTLIVNGNISTSSLTTVQTGATLGGSGTVGDLTIDSGGFFSPGNSPGITTVDGDYIQNGQLNMEILGLNAGNGDGFHDQVVVNGTVTLSGALSILSFSGFTPVNGDLLFILLNDDTDAISGTFTGLAQGAVVGNYLGFDWQISYTGNSGGTPSFTGGNDAVLMAIPEPRAALLGGIGVLLLLRRRRA